MCSSMSIHVPGIKSRSQRTTETSCLRSMSKAVGSLSAFNSVHLDGPMIASRDELSCSIGLTETTVKAALVVVAIPVCFLISDHLICDVKLHFHPGDLDSLGHV